MFHFLKHTYQKMMKAYSPPFTGFRSETSTALQWRTWSHPSISINLKLASFILALIIVTNIGTYIYSSYTGSRVEKRPELYLLDRADIFIDDLPAFERKVRQVSDRLDIPPEWLMSVMYSESRFDASVENLRGSGAIGLIQFMPATAKDMGTSVSYIKKLSPVEQLEYVYKYLNIFRKKYGEYKSLTDLYLAILYPKARDFDHDYILYSKFDKDLRQRTAYKQNIGLDVNKDGHVKVSDIDSRMKRLFGPAYMVNKGDELAEASF